ncbi:MAG: hypothetical protein ACTFAK_11270 [Candidatus Electronema sp. VV]
MPEILTFHEFDTSMNETTPVTSTAPEPNPCPNCGWSETDEQVFQESVLEYQQNFPEPPLWRKILRRIDNGPVLLSDFWYFSSIQALFSSFVSTFKDYGVAADFPLRNQLLLSSFVVGTAIISRFLYRMISDWIFRLRFEHDLS